MDLVPFLISLVVSSILAWLLVAYAGKRWPTTSKRFWVPLVVLFCLVMLARFLVLHFIPGEMPAVKLGTLLGAVLVPFAYWYRDNLNDSQTG